MSRIQCWHSYDDIISLENLLAAWQEFRIGKRKRKDVQQFERNLMENLINLHNDLRARTYQHGPYHAFRISDPKPRDIHKASVRDRVLHHAIYRMLYPFLMLRSYILRILAEITKELIKHLSSLEYTARK